MFAIHCFNLLGVKDSVEFMLCFYDDVMFVFLVSFSENHGVASGNVFALSSIMHHNTQIGNSLNQIMATFDSYI